METTLKFANVRTDLFPLVGAMRGSEEHLVHVTVEMTHAQVDIPIEGRNLAHAAMLSALSQTTACGAIRRDDPFRVLPGRKGVDVAHNPFRPVMIAPDITHPFECVNVDDWAEDLNACLEATDLMVRKPARLSVTVAICRETRMILALKISPDADPKSPGEARPEGRRAAGPGSIPDVPEPIATDYDDAVFATAASHQFYDQGAV